MDEVKNKIDIIIGEIEKKNEQKSIQEVINILLDRSADEKIEAMASAYNRTEIKGSQFYMQELKDWTMKNNQLYMIHADYEIKSDKKYIGRIIVFIKKVIRKMVRFIILPIVDAQNRFNTSVTSSINALYNLYNSEVLTMTGLQQTKEENVRIHRLEEQVNQLQALVSQNSFQNVEKVNLYDYIDYEEFEKYFRGTQEEIKQRQKVYIKFFEGKNNVIDLGCGRGEFLEQLREHSIDAVGVEKYDKFFEECSRKGLRVINQDALIYICQIEDESVEGIFAAQLIEHLKHEELIQLCQNAFEKLKKGGCLIFETPNPMCLSIYANAFYMDPTHEKPIHPKTLEFYLLNAGFSKVDIIFTEESKINYNLPLFNASNIENIQEINDAINMVSDMLFGSQDYAIVAYK